FMGVADEQVPFHIGLRVRLTRPREGVRHQFGHRWSHTRADATAGISGRLGRPDAMVDRPMVGITAAVTMDVDGIPGGVRAEDRPIDPAHYGPPLEVPVHHLLLLVVGPIPEGTGPGVEFAVDVLVPTPRAADGDVGPLLLRPFDLGYHPVAVIRAG